MIDTHAHYDDEKYDEDRHEVIEHCFSNEIEWIVNVGASLDSCKKTLELSEKYKNIYAAIGVHPSDTVELNEGNFNQLVEMAKHQKVVAIGEIGLDYYWKEPEPEIQKRWFEKQIDLAAQLNKPIIIHSREAANDTLQILKNKNAQNIGGVIHCYSYSKEMAKEYLKMGFYFGIGGVVTFNNAKKLKEVVEYLPLDSIVLETDAPYLAPVPFRGKRNQSTNLNQIAQTIADIKQIDIQQIKNITTENAKKLYRFEK